MKKKHILFCIIAILFFLTNKANASCGDLVQIGTKAPQVFWGSDPNLGSVPASPNSQVRISTIAGFRTQDNCSGKPAIFGIVDSGGREVAQAQGSLIKGTKVPNVTGEVYYFYIDWTNNLGLGDYNVRLNSVAGDVGVRTNISGNILRVQAVQACNLGSVGLNPNNINFGESITAIVTGKGTCTDWGVNVRIIEVTGNRNAQAEDLGNQKFPAGSNQLSFKWTPKNSPPVGNQAVYKAVATLGNQTLESTNFIVCSKEGNCNYDGVPIGPGEPGKDIPLSFNLTNPWLDIKNIFDIINKVTNFLIYAAVPLAVIFIIYAGIILLTSAGNTGRITQAKSMLWYTVIGFAVLLIGKGFFLLIESILNLGN